jgi:hypothetical protein
MAMFFKRKISVSNYCTTRLDLLFSEKQADAWLAFKRSIDDPAVARADDQNCLDHLRAASIELMLIVMIKKSAVGLRALDLSSDARIFTEGYLQAKGQDQLDWMCATYNQAFGSSAGTPFDGVTLMAASLVQSICDGECAESTNGKFDALLHAASESFISDFKQVKLVSDAR